MMIKSTEKIVSLLRAYLRACVVAVTLLFAAPLSVSAQMVDVPAEPATIVLPAGNNFDLDVGLYAVFLAERDKAFTLEQVMETGKWMPVNLALIDGARASIGETSSAPYGKGNPTWVYFKIKNDGDKRRTTILDTQRPDLRNMVIYRVGINGAITRILKHDDRQPFARRAVKHSELAVELHLEAGEQTSLYIRYVRTASEPMALKLFGTHAYQEKIRNKAVFAAAFFSVLGTIILITLLGLPALGWRISLSYVFYVATVGLWYASVTGLFFSIAVPDFPVFGNRVVEAFAILVFVGFLNMGRVLFKYHEISPRYDKILVGVIAANLIVAALVLKTNIYDSPMLAHTVSILTAVSAILYVCNGIIAVRARKDGAVVMLIGSLALFAAFAVYRYVTVAVSAGEMVVPIGRAMLIPPVSFVEISCFALAIIQAQIGIRRQRDKAQQSEFAAVQEQLRLSGALRESEASYQKASQQATRRQERLSSVSHDILQPLTSLRSMLDDIKQTDDKQTQNMQDAFDYLETLARDSLGSAVLDDDENSEADRETFKITAVTDNVFTMFKGEAKAKGLGFHYAADDAEVFSNPVELMRILNNLVSNAIKYTDKGSVTLSCRAQDGTTNITVQDTGPGMSKSEISTYLKAYKKGKASSGTGLGLYQVKAACEALGHTLKITSASGQGTSISVIV